MGFLQKYKCIYKADLSTSKTSRLSFINITRIHMYVAGHIGAYLSPYTTAVQSSDLKYNSLCQSI